MNTKWIKRILKGLSGVAFLAYIIFLAFPGISTAYAEQVSTSSSSAGQVSTSSSSAGQSLYEALRNLYGDTSSSSSSAVTSSSSSVTQEQIMRAMESSLKGPEVQDISLSEYYHENYRVYEESLNDDVSIFTNVANGTMTNVPVVLDIPDGVAAILKRNGNVIPVESREPITETGSYVLTLYVQAEDEDSKPFSEQTVSKAKFRFRIQYETGVGGYDAVTEAPDFSSEEAVSENDASRLFGEEDDGESEDTLPEDLREDDFEFTEAEAGEEETEEDTVEPAGEADTAYMAVNGMYGTYDSQSGFYKHTLASGEEFFTNVPNGMLTNEPVVLQPAENLNYTVYKDGEAYTGYTMGQYIEEAGSYSVFITPLDVNADPKTEKIPVFRFRIFNGPVSDADILNPPEGTVFRSVRYEGEDIGDKAITANGAIRLMGDGTYEITMDSDEGSTEFTVIRDTMQPFFGVQTEPNHALITYLTSDAYRCDLYKGGEAINDGGLVTEITEPGDYRIEVFDEAGNSSSYAFKVSYRINFAAVIAIIIILGLIAALILYIRRVRQKVSVR